MHNGPLITFHVIYRNRTPPPRICVAAMRRKNARYALRGVQMRDRGLPHLADALMVGQAECWRLAASPTHAHGVGGFRCASSMRISRLFFPTWLSSRLSCPSR